MPSVPTTSHAIAVVGNPGTGKSTILNGLVGRPIFKSGIAYGTGLTTHLQGHTVDNVTYYDTPGLNDVDRRKQAGEQIDELLRQDVSIKLIFVVTVINGRVRPDDAATIGLVLDAISEVDTNDRFGVAINLVSKAFVDRMRRDPITERTVRSKITGDRSTSHWCYVTIDESLQEVDDGMLITPDLARLFASVPETRPIGAVVKAVDTESYESKLEREIRIFEEKEAELARQLEEQRKLLDERNDEMKNMRGEMEEEQRARKRIEQDAKKAQEELKEELEKQHEMIAAADDEARRMREEYAQVQEEAKLKEEKAAESVKELQESLENVKEEVAAAENSVELKKMEIELQREKFRMGAGLMGTVVKGIAKSGGEFAKAVDVISMGVMQHGVEMDHTRRLPSTNVRMIEDQASVVDEESDPEVTLPRSDSTDDLNAPAVL